MKSSINKGTADLELEKIDLVNIPLRRQNYVLQPEFEFEFADNFATHKIIKEPLLGISILVIGDPHFKVSNIGEIDVYISRVLATIKQMNPSFVVILGDLLHEHETIHTSVLNKAYEFIHKVRKCVPVYVIVGNHDYINNSQFLTDKHWMNAIKEWSNVTIVDAGHIYHTNYGKILFCPYVFPGRFIEALDTIDSDWQSSRLIFCHQEIYGCKMGAIVSTDGDKWDEEFPLLISGHVHDKQRVQDNVFYTGSSIQHAFGESPNKTISFCNLDDSVQLEKINLGLSTKRIVYASVDELDTVEKHIKPNEKLRITVTGTFDEFKVMKKTNNYKKLISQGVKIVYKPRISKDTNQIVYPINTSFKAILHDLISDNPDMVALLKELSA